VTRVRTGSRLHFGLFHLPPAEPWPEFWPGTNVPARYYGGVGVMIDEPAVEVEAEPADEWSFAGADADRARSFVRAGRPHAVNVIRAAPAHAGFGSGTQLALAVAHATGERRGSPPPVPPCRGWRSAVGIHGYSHGGLIVDGGKRHARDIGTLIGAYAIPAAWRFVCVTPEASPRWSGEAERAALGYAGLQLAQPDDMLFRLCVFGIVPAVIAKDVTAFGAAVSEYNARVGDQFAVVQGGRYSTPATAAAVSGLLKAGAAGAGQSSWGPTAFGVAGDPDRAAAVARRLEKLMPAATVRVSAALRVGAQPSGV
jgi:beta-RFAP synthase